MQINQKCHHCAHEWMAMAEVDLVYKSICVDEKYEICPLCSHDPEGSHDCAACYEKNIEKEKNIWKQS